MWSVYAASISEMEENSMNQPGVVAPSKHKKHKYKAFRRRTPPGAPPGMLVTDPSAPQPVMTVLAYSPQDFVEQGVSDPQQIREFLGKWSVVWINVEGIGDAGTVTKLGELFGLHRLALEDVLHTHQRPKVEQYGDHLFIVTRMARIGEPLETEQLSLFLGKNFVLTFQEGVPGDCLGPIRERIRKKGGRIRDAGLDYLAYALLDAVVDAYFPILEQYGERLGDLEDEIVGKSLPDTIARIHAIKRDLLTLRRAIWPQRETLGALLREETPRISSETRIYMRDCYDHVTQIIDLVETYRELGADLTDIYLSSVSNRTNEIMRVLTVITTIFIPLTFIVGIYGMNFNTGISPWNMPELNWYWGYPLVLLLMLSVAVGQLAFFRRRGWLGSPKILGREKKEQGEM
jgi:magnesium transporter